MLKYNFQSMTEFPNFIKLKKGKIIINLIFLCFIMNACPVFSQRFDFFSGINYNKLKLESKPDYSYENIDLHGEWGYQIGCGFEKDFQMETFILPIRASVTFQNYKASINYSFGGHGGGNYAMGKIDKSMLGLSIYPLGVRIKKVVNINAGIQYAHIVDDKTSGIYNSWNINTPNGIDYNLKNYSTKDNWGLLLRLSFNVKLFPNLIISPQYEFNYGLKSEVNINRNFSSVRHNLGIGFSLV
jgi:hypothetical protein